MGCYNYFARFPKERLLKLVAKLDKFITVGLNALFAWLTLNESERDKTLSELGAPSKFTIKSPIVTPTTIAENFYIDVEFICKVQDKAFFRHADEDRSNSFLSVTSSPQKKKISDFIAHW